MTLEERLGTARDLLTEIDADLAQTKQMANDLHEKHAEFRRSQLQRQLQEVELTLMLAKMTTELEYAVTRNEARVRMIDRALRAD